jgi:hypothetical protein
MGITDQDYKAMETLLKSEARRNSRNVLLIKIEKEIGKPVDSINPEYIGSLVDSLYTLDNTPPPRLGKERLEAAALGVKRRAMKPAGGFFPRKSGRILRGVSAACAAALLFVLVNFGVAWATGGCLLRKVDTTLCTHTVFCPAGEETPVDTPTDQEYQNNRNDV